MKRFVEGEPLIADCVSQGTYVRDTNTKCVGSLNSEETPHILAGCYPRSHAM